MLLYIGLFSCVDLPRRPRHFAPPALHGWSDFTHDLLPSYFLECGSWLISFRFRLGRGMGGDEFGENTFHFWLVIYFYFHPLGHGGMVGLTKSKDRFRSGRHPESVILVLTVSTVFLHHYEFKRIYRWPALDKPLLPRLSYSSGSGPLNSLEKI